MHAYVLSVLQDKRSVSYIHACIQACRLALYCGFELTPAICTGMSFVVAPAAVHLLEPC
jgi:hypothetical protein